MKGKQGCSFSSWNYGTCFVYIWVAWDSQLRCRSESRDRLLAISPLSMCLCIVYSIFVALYQAFKLLTYIDKNKSFSELSVSSLRYIKYCAITISILIVLEIIFLAIFIEGDRPGVIMLGLIGTFASSVIATFTAVLQKL